MSKKLFTKMHDLDTSLMALKSNKMSSEMGQYRAFRKMTEYLSQIVLQYKNA